MTEAEWLACADPTPMLEFLGRQVSHRKRRLFLAACCARCWGEWSDLSTRTALSIVRRIAESGMPRTPEAIVRIRRGQAVIDSSASDPVYPVEAYELLSGEVLQAQVAAGAVPSGLAAVIEHLAYPTGIWYMDRWVYSFDAAGLCRLKQVELLRDLVHGPYRALYFRDLWRRWNDGTVRRLAEGIYEDQLLPEGTFDANRLAILSDALLDAGCDEEALIQHCREPGPHMRGCWAVDLCLGLS